MVARIAHIWRHPIKSLGREAVETLDLEPGKTMPWDRVWAIAHEASKFNAETPEWARCANFIRAAKAPSLIAVTARTDEATGHLTLSHPEKPQITVNPDDAGDAAALVDWVRPLVPENRAQPKAVVKAPGRGMTDTAFPSISINGLSSLRTLSQKIGQDLQMERFRGNFWIDGLGPWEEFEWIGRELKIGTATLAVKERIARCTATTANPESGKVDADTLGTLRNGWGHQDFGVYAEVTHGGTVSLGDTLSVI